MTFSSPYLFGHSLWDETRIPLFEQSVNTGQGFPPRVSFGEGYVRDFLVEIFEENDKNHQILIPMVHNTPAERLQHVRFHNGTLWRWNRPLPIFKIRIWISLCTAGRSDL